MIKDIGDIRGLVGTAAFMATSTVAATILAWMEDRSGPGAAIFVVSSIISVLSCLAFVRLGRLRDEKECDDATEAAQAKSTLVRMKLIKDAAHLWAKDHVVSTLDHQVKIMNDAGDVVTGVCGYYVAGDPSCRSYFGFYLSIVRTGEYAFTVNDWIIVETGLITFQHGPDHYANRNRIGLLTAVRKIYHTEIIADALTP